MQIGSEEQIQKIQTESEVDLMTINSSQDISGYTKESTICRLNGAFDRWILLRHIVHCQ